MKPTIYFFTQVWCHFCEEMKPALKELIKHAKGKSISVVEVNCEKNPKLAKEYKVTGYPTIIYVNGTRKEPYEGARDKDSLIAFYNSKLTLTGGSRCQAITQKGSSCKNKVQPRRKYCKMHSS